MNYNILLLKVRWSVQILSQLKLQLQKNLQSSSPKAFIYLTQTEQCLPPNLATSSEIYNLETCNWDAIVLSLRTKCPVRKLQHITYQFYPSSTWGTGQNVLYFAAIARSPVYHYYIFLDEDVVLRFNSFAAPEMRRLPPFRVFEKMAFRLRACSWRFGLHRASWGNLDQWQMKESM